MDLLARRVKEYLVADHETISVLHERTLDNFKRCEQQVQNAINDAMADPVFERQNRALIEVEIRMIEGLAADRELCEREITDISCDSLIDEMRQTVQTESDATLKQFAEIDQMIDGKIKALELRIETQRSLRKRQAKDIENLIQTVRREVDGRISYERAQRLQTEDRLIMLLEQTCIKIEGALI